MLRLIVLSTAATIVAFLFFAIPAQADEIEPEFEPIDESTTEPEPEPEPDPEPEPERTRDDDYDRSGAYLGVNLAGAWYRDLRGEVRSSVDSLPPSKWSSSSSDLENPVGIGARGGYRFLPYLAGEVELQWFANSNTELDNSDPTISVRRGETINALKVETLRVTGNVKGYIPIGRLHPFLLAGAGFMHASGDDRVGLGVTTDGDAFAARFGGGIDVYLNRNFVAVAEAGYVWIPTGKLDHLDHVLWSVGLTYRF